MRTIFSRWLCSKIKYESILIFLLKKMREFCEFNSCADRKRLRLREWAKQVHGAAISVNRQINSQTILFLRFQPSQRRQTHCIVTMIRTFPLTLFCQRINHQFECDLKSKSVGRICLQVIVWHLRSDDQIYSN